MIKYFLLLTGIFLIHSAYGYADNIEASLGSCGWVDLHVQPIGFRCEAAFSGSPVRIFKRVELANFEEAWQRESDGTIWALKVLAGSPISPEEAKKICTQLGVRLPSTSDFKYSASGYWAEGGVPMVLSIQGGHYWTSSKGSSGEPVFLNGWATRFEEWESYRIPPKDVVCVKKLR